MDKYKFGFRFMAHRSFTRTSRMFTVTCTNTTQCVLAVLNEIKSRKCFTIKTTIFHHIANNRALLVINNFTMTSLLTSSMRHSFYKLLVLFTGSLLHTGWIKTRPVQKLLVRVKFSGNLYSYVCEQPPLKYSQTHVCRNSYMGTRTLPDSYSCLCERSLRTRLYQLQKLSFRNVVD